MIKSMTGFGRAQSTVDGMTVTVELKSVNHRYFEFSTRVPRNYGFLEEKLKSFVNATVARGKTECYVSIENPENDEVEVTVNTALARGYAAAIRSLSDLVGTNEQPTAAQLSRFPDVLTVLSGMTYMEHLQDNLRTFSPLVPCTEEEFTLLEDTAQRMLQYPTVPCNDCKYCMPCPYGLDIPAILLHYNRCINEGNVPQNSQDENYREARRAFLIGYDRSVPRLRQANRCTGCGQCNPHCPQGIDIPAKLQEIDRFVEALKQETL